MSEINLELGIFTNLYGKEAPEMLVRKCYHISNKIFIFGYDSRFNGLCLLLDLSELGRKYIELGHFAFKRFCDVREIMIEGLEERGRVRKSGYVSDRVRATFKAKPDSISEICCALLRESHELIRVNHDQLYLER